MISMNNQGGLSFDCGLIDAKLQTLTEKLQQGKKDIFALVQVRQFENELSIRKQEIAVCVYGRVLLLLSHTYAAVFFVFCALIHLLHVVLFSVVYQSILMILCQH